MTETDLTMPMKFEEINFFILFSNHTVSAKVIGSMTSSLRWYDKPSNTHNAFPNMKLVTSLNNFECQPCGIFEGLSYHQEDEAIDPIIFADTVGHRWGLPVLRYHEIMVIYPYPFVVVITQLFSWIIFINDCICILTGSSG